MPNLHDAGNHKEQKILEKKPNSPPSAWKDVENSNSLKPYSLQKLNKSTEHSKCQANSIRKIDNNEDYREFCTFGSHKSEASHR